MKSISFQNIALLLIIIFAGTAYGQKLNVKDQPEELGEVAWFRDLDQAKEQSIKLNKPILILFQEVPGCATCRNYGNNVLSHPLLVEVIENEFIPLAIYNNKGGSDAKVLKLYDEPSWNNPVLRIINSEGKNIVTRHAGKYDAESLISYMQLALIAAKGKLPEYVELFNEELNDQDKQISEAYYSMYCFWTGEAKLGSLDGVVSTSPGFMGGHEVVKVRYDKDVVSVSEISKEVKSNKFTFVKDPSHFRMDKDPQYYLKKSTYKYLPLTVGQRTKINSAIANNNNPNIFLSPTQKFWYNELSGGHKNDLDLLYENDILKSWKVLKEKFTIL